MLVYDILRLADHNGAITRLKHSTDVAYHPFQWDHRVRSYARSDIAIDKFMSLPRATPSELSATDLTFRDVEDEV